MKRLLFLSLLAIAAQAQTIKELPEFPCARGGLVACAPQYKLTLQTPANESVVAVRYTITAVLAITGQAITVTGVIQRLSPRAALWANFSVGGVAEQFTVRLDELAVIGTTISTVEVSK